MSTRSENHPVWHASFSHSRLDTVTCWASEKGLTALSFGPPEPVPPAGLPLDENTPEAATVILANAIQQLQAYLARQRQNFDLPFDLSACTDFQLLVLAQICKIPYGQVITYGQIALLVGGMKHVRAVGGAVGSNPLPILIPCHRVVSTGGQMRGYSGWGGIRTKTWLLQLEGQLLISEEMDS